MILNTASVLLLTLLLVRLDTWSDAVASAVNAFSQTAAWVWFRSALGVHGPENEQDLMIALLAVAALAVSVAAIWAINRFVSGIVTSHRTERKERSAG